MKPLILLFPMFFALILMACSMQNDEKDFRAFIEQHVKIICTEI